MSQDKLNNALASLLTAQSSVELHKILTDIRKDVEWPRNKDNITRIREKKSLKYIVASLNSQQRNVLNVSLSILGNCLMDRDCSRDAVGHYNILMHINQLLKRFPKDDSIIGRIFRIIGNLCQHRDQWANIILDRKPQIVTYIVNFVTKISKDELPEGETVSEATSLMAVRSLRCLLNSRTIMTLVKTFGVLKAVGALFIKYCIQWQEDRSRENLLHCIIRLLQDYSRYKYYHSISEMRNTERGDALVYLSSILLLAPKRVVKIVMNLIRICQLKSELPVPEIFDTFLDLLQRHSIVEELNGECVEYLQCLCYLLEHPANRTTERCGKCIPLLIRCLKEFKDLSITSLECCILLIGSLNKYKFDERLIQEQIKANVLNVLTDKLCWLVGRSPLNTDHRNQSKRLKIYLNNIFPSKRVNTLAYEEMLEPRSTYSDDDIDFVSKFDRCPSPPSPCSSSASDINYACSWPSSSPSSVNHLSDSDSDDYSPVCSEMEMSDVEIESRKGEEGERSPDDVDKASEMSDRDEKATTSCGIVISESLDKSKMTNLKIRLFTEISKLIKIYAEAATPIPQLASEELLMVLLKCSGHFQWQHNTNVNTVDIICKIISCHEYLIGLMTTNFIETIQQLTKRRHGSRCMKCGDQSMAARKLLAAFTAVAESGIGKGDIAHQMLRGDPALRKQLVLVLPYIIKNRAILSKLLLNCGGLNILLKMLLNEEEKGKSIKVICTLASNKLLITNPKNSFPNRDFKLFDVDQYKEPDCKNPVILRLEDGSHIKADREFLSEHSDFFGRMFNGYFKESLEDEIVLQEVKIRPLKCLLHLMQTFKKDRHVDIDLDLDTLLEVIVLCDRFLMTDLGLSLSESVGRNKLTSVTVPQIYRWSLESGTNILRVECIAYALVASLSEENRLNMFETLLELGRTEEILDDIQKLLTRFLTISGFDGDDKFLRVHLKRMKDHLIKNY